MNDIIKRLLLKKERIIKEKTPSKKRVAFSKIKEALDEDAFPILFGLRRVGKTTLLKQIMKESKEKSIYIAFRDLYISSLSPLEIEELIEKLYNDGFRLLLIDEAQLQNKWSEIIVGAFDSFHDLKIVVTGSSSLNLELKETGLDRTRKIIVQTLSFGEYCYLANKVNTQENFEKFLGNFGFPKYALEGKEDFDVQRAEIFEEIINNDIPAEYRDIDSTLMSRLVVALARRSNGEINISGILKEVGPNFLQRDALRYIEILEKSKVLKKIFRLNGDLSFPKVRKFKIFFNPHIHLWILNTPFKNLDDKFKGHIVESYWLFWAYSINSYNKNFFYMKDVKNKNLEIDFVSYNNSSVGPSIKTLHEIKYSKRKNFNLSFMKEIDSSNKIVWNINGQTIDGIEGKSILKTFDKEI